MIVIYTPELSLRIQYAFKLVFSEVLGVEYSISTDLNTFINTEGGRINYSQNKLSGIIGINPSGLLEEKSIKNWNPLVGKWEELPVIFANDDHSVPFDIFSAVFFLVTRYEEYLPFNPDQYGRFMAEESLSCKNGFLRFPIVDLWCKKLATVLKINNQCKNLSENNYRFRLTIDIDYPWLFRNRGWLYASGSLMRELVRFNFSQFTERLKVLTGYNPDPADNYDFISETWDEPDHPVQYFILCRHKGKLDPNRSVNRKVFHCLIQELDTTGRVGIHPSFVSRTSDNKLKQEISYLSGVLKRDIISSRQHFLCLKFPDTYLNLIKFGIKEDYSMGYSSQTGFRAGIARSFNFFDLINNKETGLRVFPFQVMDRTLLSYMKLSPDEALKEFEYYTGLIRSIGGEFICLWHNDSLSDRGEWQGWKNVFKKMIDMNS